MFRTVSLYIITSLALYTAIGIGHAGYVDCLLASSQLNQFLRFFKFIFGIRLRILDSMSVHRQESSTVHTAIGIGHAGYADCLLASSQHNQFLRFFKFIFGIRLYVFWTVCLSIVRSLALYTQQ